MLTTLRRLLLALLLVLVPAGASAQSWVAAPEIEEGPALPEIPAHWTTVPGTFLRVHGADETLDVLLRVARHGSASLPALAERLEVPIGGTVHVYVVSSDEEFRTLQPGRPPGWADATAWPKLGAIFLRAPHLRIGGDEPLEQVLDHELAHILLGRAFAPNHPPAWLQEGVAQVLAGQVGPQVARTLSDGAAIGALPDLESIERGFPVDPHQARLAYAQSADFVAFLEQRHGPDALPRLIRAGAGGATMRAAVYAATGRFLDDVEADWSERFDRGFTLAPSALTDGTMAFALGGVALVVAGVARRRRFHRRLEEMAREEALLDALVEQLRARRAAFGAPPPTPRASGT